MLLGIVVIGVCLAWADVLWLGRGRELCVVGGGVGQGIGEVLVVMWCGDGVG